MPDPVVDPGVLAASRTHDRSDPDVTPLSGREQAGVMLTWGVLGLVALTVLGFLLTSALGADPADVLGDAPREAEALSAYVAHAEALRGSRRAFLLDGLEAVIASVLFPVLTGLLGYIFGSGAAR